MDSNACRFKFLSTRNILLLTLTRKSCANKMVTDQTAQEEQSDQGLFVTFLQYLIYVLLGCAFVEYIVFGFRNSGLKSV